MPTNNAINANSIGLARYDGAGTWDGVTTTIHCPLIGAATNGITSAGPLTNGQLLIGNTGNDPSAAALAPGAGISITNGAGIITVAATGSGFNTVDATLATYTIVLNTRYITNRAGGVVYTLPATATIQDSFKIVGKLGTWSIAENANQQLIFGKLASTVTTGGVASTADTDCVTFTCITPGASTVWSVEGSQGNLTVT